MNTASVHKMIQCAPFISYENIMFHSFLLGVRIVTRILHVAGKLNRCSGFTSCNVTDACCFHEITSLTLQTCILLYPRHLCRRVYSFRLSVRPFVRSYVRSFVRSWNLRQSFALKFLKWCISQQLLIRKHSYLDHSYPGGLAFSP